MTPHLRLFATGRPEFGLEDRFRSTSRQRRPWGSSRPSNRVGIGIANDKDDVDRPLLSGGPRSGDRDQGRYATGCGGLRDRTRPKQARQKQDRDGAGAERSGEGGPAAAARHPCRDRGHAGWAAGAVGDPVRRTRRDGQDSRPALARCQRQGASRRKPAPDWIRGGYRWRKHVKQRRSASVPVQSERKRVQCRSARAASSAHDRQKADRKREQQPAEAARSLALPAGRHGKRFEVAGPFAEMQPVRRADALPG